MTSAIAPYIKRNCSKSSMYKFTAYHFKLEGHVVVRNLHKTLEAEKVYQ